VAARPFRRILSLHAIFLAVIPFLLMVVLTVCLLFPQITPEIESQQRQLAQAVGALAAGLLAALLPGIAASLYLARRLSGQLEALAASARQVAAGQEGVEWPRHDIAEVEQLGDDLQAMAGAIRARERQLLETELLLRSVMDHAFQYQWLLAPDGSVVDSNRAAVDLVGIRKESVLGLPFRETPWWSHDAQLREKLGAALVSCSLGERVRFESTHLDLRGQVHRADFSLNPMLDDAGQVCYLIAEGRDITASQQALEALKESDERFHQIFAQNDDAIILIHLGTLRIIDANPAALALYGVSHRDLANLHPEHLIDRMDFLKLVKAFDSHDISQGFTLQKAASFKVSGERIYIALKGKIIHLKEEEVLLCSIREITEKIRLEEEMRLTQAKLIQANKMTSLGMLVSSVAHEINNPNHCISVNNSVLTRIWQDVALHLHRLGAADDNFQLGGLPYQEIGALVPQLHTGITESSRRIGNIVKEMKGFVKPEKLDMQGVVEINQVVQSSTSILWHHIQKHTNNYRSVLGDDIPPLKGSRQQLEQVVINLIMNALQSLPDQSSAVCLRTSFEPASDSIVISVQDEGIGMTEDVLTRLTEPFFTMRIDRGGTGLGLYISSSIVKEHRGVLEFTSEPGKGTTATIRLPAAHAA
jgi:PAS domain S-box-containing protein